MNVLAHRNINQMDVRGTVEVNDRPIGTEITSMSAYIQQEDIFVGSLTVREHLIFQVSYIVSLFELGQGKQWMMWEVDYRLGFNAGRTSTAFSLPSIFQSFFFLAEQDFSYLHRADEPHFILEDFKKNV